MKKLLLGLIIIAALAVYLFKTQPNTAAVEQPNVATPNATEPNLVNKKQPAEGTPLRIVTDLKKDIRLCRDQSQQQHIKINNLNQSLVSFFVSELKKGTSVPTILKYANLSEINKRQYIAFLRDAIVTEQKQQLNITSSLNELANWQGIEAIKGFTNDKVKEMIQQLGDNKHSPPGLTLSVPLDENVQKETLYALLNNTDTFTTYSKTFIKLEGSEVISPATLFVLNANKFTPKEFEQAISTNQFTVNELATAIKNNIPNEYIFALMKQVPALDAMPLYEENSVLYNMADIAVSQFNLPLVKALQQLGVTPTNRPGLFTGLDVAIVNLPRSGNLTPAPLDAKHTQMLDYLTEQGYKAHSGNANDDLNGKGVSFVSDFIYQQGAYINGQENPEQYAYFNPIGKIDNATLPQVSEPDNSDVARFLVDLKQQKKDLDNKRQNCELLQQQLSATEQLHSTMRAYNTVLEVKKEHGNNFEYVLQEQDPVLVNYWWSILSNQLSNDRSHNAFSEYLSKKDYQKAYEYSLSTPLTQTETDTLFSFLLLEPHDFIAIWQSRVEPKPPSDLARLSRFPLSQWQKLKQAGFDFSITDTYGRDVYVQAASSSVEVVQFLIDNKIPADSEKLGVDILDLALEQSYTKGELSPMIPLALQLVEKIEPNHLSRAARLKTFYAEVYEQLIKLNPALKPAEGTQLNHYTFNNL
ncbi:cupric reductase [Pseudoalteromonas sp. SR43-6]|uniref:cupric reductase n=1 Tax=unclassified Pseudoalteromonas TaxID=194690 RepID=UPI0015FC2BA6|nr:MULTISPECIES: cupric reductase [unclassified Pseudoalteromonas]MBB1288824.1 cupric reductase [Pseudoalteromonas sp. SR41-5]MBB1374763.1 cupric reductase [Pseudoalteromonas sp. SR43-6]MBB1413877.1 cupric reductase [Pseudoalteromonas sp. SG43-8]